MVELELPARMSARRRLELQELVRYCAARIEREQAPAIRTWSVQLATEPGGWRARVIAHAAATVEAVGRAALPDAAIWEAMCRVEQPLREARVALAAA